MISSRAVHTPGYKRAYSMQLDEFGLELMYVLPDGGVDFYRFILILLREYPGWINGARDVAEMSSTTARPRSSSESHSQLGTDALV